MVSRQLRVYARCVEQKCLGLVKAKRCCSEATRRNLECGRVAKGETRVETGAGAALSIIGQVASRLSEEKQRLELPKEVR